MTASHTPFTHRLRVRYSECDMQGVAFNANWVDWMDIALNELWRDRCGPYDDFSRAGYEMAVAEVNVQFRRPARFDQDVDITVHVTQIGTTSLITGYQFTHDETLLAEGTYRHVCIDGKEFQKTPWPEHVRDQLAA